MKPMNANIFTSIVDDDIEDFREIIHGFLEENGIVDVKYFDNHTDFLNAIGADINIAVIDHTLPGTTGVEVTKEVKAKNSFSYVIILTGQTDYRVMGEYINAKADAYINKNDGFDQYINKLITELKAGFEEVRKRVQFVKVLEAAREQI